MVGPYYQELLVQGNNAISPPHSACAPSESPSLDWSVVPLYLILIVGNSRILATGLVSTPWTISLALRIIPPGGASSIEITTDSKSTVRSKYLVYLFWNMYVFLA